MIERRGMTTEELNKTLKANDLKVIKKEMKNEKILEERKAFQEIFLVSDDEVKFFEHLYKKERRYRTVILILSLICVGLLLLVLM